VWLETGRLVLAPLDVDDVDEMVVALADPELYRFIGGSPPTLEGLRGRYRRLVVGRSDDGTQAWHNWVARTRRPRAVGTLQATITALGAQAEMAWVIARAEWGQGYATEAATAVMAWLEQIGVQRITAHIHPGNRPSVTVAERIGLSPTETYDDGERLWERHSAPYR
jgi:RimJ/RimL family protein N-acetyltransferase